MSKPIGNYPAGSEFRAGGKVSRVWRGWVQDAQEAAPSSEAGRMPAENERKLSLGTERLEADMCWIVTPIEETLAPKHRPGTAHA